MVTPLRGAKMTGACTKQDYKFELGRKRYVDKRDWATQLGTMTIMFKEASA